MKITLKISSYILIVLSVLALLGLVLYPSGESGGSLGGLVVVGLLITHGILTLVYIDRRD